MLRAAFLLALLLGGCARSLESAQLTSDHPANPDAVAAAIPPGSMTLALNVDGGADASTEHGGHEGHVPPTTGPSVGQVVHVCPMHPEVVSAKANDECPKCGMYLKPRQVPAPPASQPISPAHGGHHHHGGH